MPKPIVSLNEESLKADLRELVRRTVEEMLNGLLDEEADDLVGAERYERTADREAYRAGHYERIEFTAVELGQTRAHIAANGLHDEVRELRAQHQLAAQTGRADNAARRHGFKRLEFGAHKGVARILALADGCQGKSFGQFHRNILQRMHRQISAAFHHGRLKLLDKKSFAAHLRERTVKDLIAASRHAQNFNRGCRILLFQERLHVQGLPHGQRTFTSSNDAMIEFRHDE